MSTSIHLVRDNTKEEINRVIRLIQGQTSVGAATTPATPASFGNFFSPSSSTSGGSGLNLTSYKIFTFVADATGQLAIDDEGFLQTQGIFVAKVV